MDRRNSKKPKLRLLAGLVALSAFSAFAGKTYYVDAVYGDDENDGERPGKGRARKTLAGVMRLVTADNNDVVYAAPGRYDEGTVTNDTAVFRVNIPKRTALIASGLAEETFIMGASASDGKRVDDHGSGEDAVRCVKMTALSNLSGFTVTGSRTEKTPTGGTYFGAINGDALSTTSDCIITNNVGYRGGGGYYAGSFVRCFFKDNIAVNQNGANLMAGSAYNCVFDNTQDGANATYQTACYNCTFVGKGYSAKEASIFNCLLSNAYDANVSLYGSVYVKSPNRTAKLIDENSKQAEKSQIALDAHYRPLAGSLAIDAGSNNHYSIPSGYEHQERFDFHFGERTVNGTIDCGAVEFGGDFRGDLARTLNPSGRVRVKTFTGEVTTNGQGAVRIPAGSAMRIFWPYPAGASGSVDFRFGAEIVGGASLTVKRFGAEAPFKTVSQTGVFSFSSDIHETLVLSATGAEGEAVDVFGLHNASYVFIDDPGGALCVEGGAVGINEVVPGGEARTLTVTRNAAAPSRCVGVTVNGTYHAFQGEEADVPLVLELEDGDAPTAVKAVLADRADWFVDDVCGDDGNLGDAPYRAKKTLAGAMAIPVLLAGDVVHAAPGIYDEGLMPPTSATTNRVAIPAGVGLVADKGSDVTVIEGFIPVEPEGDIALSKNGGPSSVRCVSMDDGAYIKGFTLRNGSTAIEPGEKDRYAGQGGGVYGGTAIDCVISNCYAVRGGGATLARLIRCRIFRCGNVTGKNAQGGWANPTASGVLGGSIYDSFVDGYSSVLNPAKVVNSTLLSSTWHNGTTRYVQVYNSYIGSDNGRLALTNSCVLSPKSSSILGEGAVSGVNLWTYADGKTYRPQASSRAIDAGNRAYYVYPEAFAHEAGKDVLGGARVYNGQIDIGCGEYDWRGEFSQALDGKGRIEVVAAGPGVVAGGDGSLVLSAGDELVLDWDLPYAGTLAFSVSGEGAESVAVTVDGKQVGRDGDGMFRFGPCDGVSRIVIRQTGEAPATVGGFGRSTFGLRIIVK